MKESPRWSPGCASAAALLLSLCVAGCSDEDKITVENGTQPQANRPPSIIAYGPEMPPGGFDLISHSGPQPIDFWVIVGDADGTDDVIFVGVDIDSVRLNRFLVRPDTSFCINISYAPSDTLPSASILAVPALLPGVSKLPLRQEQGGYYTAENFGDLGFGFPDFVRLSPVLKPWTGGCTTFPWAVIGPIVVTPPAVPSERTAIISYADLDFIGIRINVFDSFGASASQRLPNWHLVYRTPDEAASPP